MENTEVNQQNQNAAQHQGAEVDFSSNSSNSKAYRKKKAFDDKVSDKNSASFSPPRKSKSRSRSRSRSSKDRSDMGGNERRKHSGDKGGRNDRFRREPRIEYPPYDRAMYTRKDFENYQDGRFDRSELADAYNKYCKTYKKEQEHEFYSEHKIDPWFIERYDPSEVFKGKQIQKKLSQYNAERFNEDVFNIESDNKYLSINLDQDQASDYNLLHDKEGKDLKLHQGPHFAFDTDSLTLYLKYIPVNIKRFDLQTVLKENLQGFVHLSMSEPMRNHDFTRLAWVNFSNDHDCEQALEKIPNLQIEEFNLQAAKSHPNKKKTPVRITPPLPHSMILQDYQICKRLITEVYDKQKEISTSVIDAVESFSAKKKELNPESNWDQWKLDVLLLYLRRVHAYCLYCGEEYEDERMLSTRCGPQHIRHYQKINEEEFQEILQKSVIAQESQNEPKAEGELEDEVKPETQQNDTIDKITKLGQDSSKNWGGSMNFLQRYVSQALKKIKDGSTVMIDPENDLFQKDLDDFYKYKCKEIIPGERYSCEICKKVFKGEDFVIKHVKNKHQDVVDKTYEREDTKNWLERTIQIKLKKQMKQNYYGDENKLFNQPGRKYHGYESNYQSGGRGDSYGDSGQRGGYRGRGGFRGGRGGRGGGFQSNYVDRDDPEFNKTTQATKRDDGRELVDYSSLFS